MKSISIICGFPVQDDDTNAEIPTVFQCICMLDSSTLWLVFQPNQQIVCAWNSTHNRGTICVAWGRIRAGIPNSFSFQKGKGILKMFRQFKAEGGKILQNQKCRVFKNGMCSEQRWRWTTMHTYLAAHNYRSGPLFEFPHLCSLLINWDKKNQIILSQKRQITWSILIPRPWLSWGQYTWSTLEEGTHSPLSLFVQSKLQRSRSEIRRINNQPYSIIQLTSGHVFEAGRRVRCCGNQIAVA